jgi:hypothetical protein
MSMITQFSPSTIEAIKHYVYALTDDRGQIFYIGKGSGNRVFAHVDEVRELLARGALVTDDEADDAGSSDDKQSLMGPKRERIAELLKNGKSPGMYVLREGISADEALLVESVLISVIDWQGGGTLTNAVSGRGAATFGLKSVAELEATKGQPFDVSALPDLGTAPEVIAINVNRRFAEVESGKATLLEIAKGDWKLGIARARACAYAVIHARGIVRGVFRIDRWQESPRMPGRYEFIASSPEPLQGAAYANRNVDGMFRDGRVGSQNPIRYVSVGRKTL